MDSVKTGVISPQMAALSVTTSRDSMSSETKNKQTSDNRILSSDPRFAGQPATPPPVKCEFCGNERYTEGLLLPTAQNRVFWFPGGAMPCTCPEGLAQHERVVAEREAQEVERKKAEEDEKMRARVKRVIGDSGMGERFLRRTFETFTTVTAEQEQAKRAAMQYAGDFDKHIPKRGEPLPEWNGFFISGTKGTGKTHLAAAIANYLLNRGTAAICMTERELFGRIRRTYSQRDGDESEVLETYKRVPLLIIDDLGKERATDWTLSTLYAIIDGRYGRAMPLIVTTNYGPGSLAGRLTPQGDDGTTAECIIDRINEMCRAIIITGPSWRSK